jgi:hypothetical protein
VLHFFSLKFVFFDAFVFGYVCWQVVGFFPKRPDPPLFGRKKCQETTIEECIIMGPRMP